LTENIVPGCRKVKNSFSFHVGHIECKVCELKQEKINNDELMPFDWIWGNVYKTKLYKSAINEF